MHLRAPAVLLAARPHGETAVVARMLTEEHGVVAGYVAGGRGRRLRPVVIPATSSSCNSAPARTASCRSPSSSCSKAAGRGSASRCRPRRSAGLLRSRHRAARAAAYPTLYQALDGLLDAICHAPRRAAGRRRWSATRRCCCASSATAATAGAGDFADALAAMDRLAGPLDHYLLADRRGDVMAARSR
jgi:DNA repair protein RecO (recombination protein O)